MLPRKQINNPTFAFVTKGLVDLHRLIKAGQEDSPSAEAIRDALDGPLAALNLADKQRAQWLSEDLYSISEPVDESTLKPMNPQAQQHLNEAYEARQRGDLDYALTLLRRWKDYISPALLSYLRGSIWLEAYCPDPAAMFLEHAAKLDPANAAYLESHLRAMLLAKPESALQMSKEILADVDKHHPIVVVRAANIRFNAIDPAQYTESALVCKNLELVLKHNLTRLEKCDEIASQFPDYCANLALLGLCNEFLGDVNAAADYYSRGILANPNDDLLLAARGILTYGQSAQSIVDLEQAAQLSTELIWPYYFLAHHYLSSQQYDRCRITCERGLQTAGTDLAKSQLEEWRAIAQSELGFSPDLVRTAFEAAIRLDPSNEQARRNLVRFEEALASNPRPQRLTWEQRTESAIRSFGLAERRFSLAA